jgi:hypothetical protein
MSNLYEYRDNAHFTIGIPLESQFTIGRGEAYGLELFLNKRIGSFTGWIGYTLAWTKRYFDELNNGKSFYPRYDRRHDISIVGEYKITDSYEVSASWVYGTGQAFTIPTGTFSFPDLTPDDGNNIKYNNSERNGYRLPAFHKLDLNIMHYFEWFNLPFQLSLNIYNVYNHVNPFSWKLKYSGNLMSKQNMQFDIISLFPTIPTLGLSFKF